MEIYGKFQYQFGHRKRYKQKVNRLNEYLPLSGFLECPKCGGNLTGSGSTSKTSKKHYYYHCNTRNGCNERFRVEDVHKEFMNLMHQIVPNDEVCELFRLILNDNYQSAQCTRLSELNKVNNDIKDVESEKDLLMEKLLSGIIQDKDYQRFKTKMDKHLSELKILRSDLGDVSDDIRVVVDFGLYLLRNYNKLFEIASVEDQQKILVRYWLKNWCLLVKSIEPQCIRKD